MVTLRGPFADHTPADVQLKDAPLVRTIAQVRFPSLTQFAASGPAIANGVAAALAADYPLMEAGQEFTATITPDGVTQQQSAPVWRLFNADSTWQVTFASNFISVDTTGYESREKFAERVTDAWEALTKQVDVPRVERVGVRYVNNVTNPEHLADLAKHLEPHVLGIAGGDDGDNVTLVQALSEAQYRFNDGAGFHARWGMLPANVRLDATCEPNGYPTWLLDMDSFRDQGPIDIGGGMRHVIEGLASRGYQFFRWAVTADFLTESGATS